MAIPNTTRIQRRPTHPGEMLRENFIPDYGLSVARLAELLGVSRQSVNELLRERRSVSPEMALRLGRLFGNSPEFWLNAQRAVDLWQAPQSTKDGIARIKPLARIFHKKEGGKARIPLKSSYQTQSQRWPCRDKMLPAISASVAT